MILDFNNLVNGSSLSLPAHLSSSPVVASDLSAEDLAKAEQTNCPQNSPCLDWSGC